MKVHELIKLLQEQNQDAYVLLARDPEGNSFYHADPIIFVGNYKIEHDTIQIGYYNLTLPLIKQGYTEEDVIHNDNFCIVIYPLEL